MMDARCFAELCGAELHVALIGTDHDTHSQSRALLAASASAGKVARQHCHHRDGDCATALDALCRSLPGSAFAVAATAPAALLEAAAAQPHGLLLVPATSGLSGKT
ncbi:hypothetical protein [Solimonas soli]|uniref:hypothetical protein n=1 Tax=Solimonas soli TaxID=413479 RepID=UPI0012FB47F6